MIPRADDHHGSPRPSWRWAEAVATRLRQGAGIRQEETADLLGFLRPKAQTTDLEVRGSNPLGRAILGTDLSRAEPERVSSRGTNPLALVPSFTSSTAPSARRRSPVSRQCRKPAVAGRWHGQPRGLDLRLDGGNLQHRLYRAPRPEPRAGRHYQRGGAPRPPPEIPPAFSSTVVPSRTVATASPRRRGATSWRRHGAAGRR